MPCEAVTRGRRDAVRKCKLLLAVIIAPSRLALPSFCSIGAKLAVFHGRVAVWGRGKIGPKSAYLVLVLGMSSCGTTSCDPCPRASPQVDAVRCACLSSSVFPREKTSRNGESPLLPPLLAACQHRGCAILSFATMQLDVQGCTSGERKSRALLQHV